MERTRTGVGRERHRESGTTIVNIIPNTALFGPTKLIETTIASTMARMKISAEDFG